MNRLGHIFGFGLAGAISSVIVQGLIFGSVHFQWGVGGMVTTSIMGMIWGAAFLLCDRNLWIMIIAHSTGHVLMVAHLYFQKAGEVGGAG